MSEVGVAPGREVPERGSRVALFSEVVLVGALAALLSLGVVTALPAGAAAVAHLRRHVDGRSDTVGDLLADFRAAWRDLWLVAVLGLTGFALLGLDAVEASSGALPGGPTVLVVLGLLSVALLVVLLRTAGCWQAGSGGLPAVRTAARRATGDPVGDVLLLAAVGVCAVLMWMLPPLVVVAPGLLALAVAGVEQRNGRERG
jgi:hypothetical protein